MIRHKLRKGIVHSSVFLASQHWQYSGNGFRCLNQVFKLKSWKIQLSVFFTFSLENEYMLLFL
jgi:hypothetical protein